MRHLLICSLLLILGSPASAQDGWIEMFNGKNLLGWHVNENADSVYVEDGCLVTHGKRAHAFFVGESGNADFKNFHFQAKVKTMPKANSGIYFHTPLPSSRLAKQRI